MSWIFIFPVLLVVAQAQQGVPAVGSEYNDRSADGSYRFGFQTGDVGGHYEAVIASKDNTLVGRFGSRDPAKGQIVETQFTAGKRGYRPRGPNVARKYDLSQNKIPYNPPVNPNSPNYNPTLDGYHDPNEDPSYSFESRTPTYTKKEAADSQGHVNGLYSFVDDAGERHDVSYEAGAKIGFNVKTPFPDSKTFTGTFYRGPPSKAGGKTVRGKTSIQQRNDGSYRFVSAGPDQRRTEVSDATGHRRGSYTYIDDKGQQRTVEYIAGPNIGYRIVSKGLGVKFPTAAPFIPQRYPDFPSGFDPSFPTEFPPFSLDSSNGGGQDGSGNSAISGSGSGSSVGGSGEGNSNFDDLFGGGATGNGGSSTNGGSSGGGISNQGGFDSSGDGKKGGTGGSTNQPFGGSSGTGNAGGSGNAAGFLSGGNTGGQTGFGGTPVSGPQSGGGSSGNSGTGGFGNGGSDSGFGGDGSNFLNNQGGFGGNQGGFGGIQSTSSSGGSSVFGGSGSNQGFGGSGSIQGFGGSGSNQGFGGSSSNQGFLGSGSNHGLGGSGSNPGFGGSSDNQVLGNNRPGSGSGPNSYGNNHGSSNPGNSAFGESDRNSDFGSGSNVGVSGGSGNERPGTHQGFPNGGSSPTFPGSSTTSRPTTTSGYSPTSSTLEPFSGYPDGRPPAGSSTLSISRPGYFVSTTTIKPSFAGPDNLASAFPEDDPNRPLRPLRPSLEDDFLQSSFGDLPRKFFNHPSYFKPKSRPGHRNEPERNDSTFLSSDKRFFSFPTGIAVRAHVQSVDILPFGSRIPSPGFALEHSISTQSTK